MHLEWYELITGSLNIKPKKPKIAHILKISLTYKNKMLIPMDRNLT